jgi:hypothetical protein
MIDAAGLRARSLIAVANIAMANADTAEISVFAAFWTMVVRQTVRSEARRTP